MMEIMNSILIILVGIFTYGLYSFYKKHKYWARLGVPYVSLRKQFVQTVDMSLGRLALWTMFCEQYDALSGHKFGGTYQMGRPSLLLRDPELIRSIMVNNFSRFHDHHGVKPSEADPLSCDLFRLHGQRWHQVRKKVTQAFSSAKLRLMYLTLQGCAEELNAHIWRVCLEHGDEGVELCVKELMANYTMEVIGASVLGIKCNAIQNPKCELRRILELTMLFSFRKYCVWFLESIWPGLPKKLGIKLVSHEILQFYRSIIKDAEEMKRTDVDPNRKDFLQILMNLQDSERHTEQRTDVTMSGDTVSVSQGQILTETIIVGVISSFLSVGYEAVASTLALCVYELALNPEVQHRLLQEISRVRVEVGGEITFEDTRRLQFMEQVISETLRKYPVATIISRCCTEPFRIPDSSVVIEKDVVCFVSTMSLHRDPKYFPDPEKFDPDRFAPENLDKIVPGSYLPFGDGPRSCIATRMVVMVIKTMLMTLVSNYTVYSTAKTPERMDFDGTRFMLTPKENLWLRLNRRN